MHIPSQSLLMHLYTPLTARRFIFMMSFSLWPLASDLHFNCSFPQQLSRQLKRRLSHSQSCFCHTEDAMVLWLFLTGQFPVSPSWSLSSAVPHFPLMFSFQTNSASLIEYSQKRLGYLLSFRTSYLINIAFGPINFLDYLVTLGRGKKYWDLLSHVVSNLCPHILHLYPWFLDPN